MIYFWTIITALLLVLCYILIRDFLNPAFILGAIWLAVYLMLIITQPEAVLQNTMFGIFFGAFLSFLIGFLLAKPSKKIYREKIVYPIEWNSFAKNILLSIIYIFCIVWWIVAVAYLGLGSSIWTSLRTGMSDDNSLSSSLSLVVQEMILIFCLVALGIYLCNPIRKNRNCFLLSCPPAFFVLLLSARGIWFMMLIAVVFIIIIIRRPKNKTILLSGLVGVGLVLAIFIFSSYDKFSNAWTYWSEEEKMDFFISSYFLSPPINFINWLTSGYKLQGGKYLFRFFCALLNTIGFEIEVVPTIQEFVVFNGYQSNVFTALYWYAIDFGKSFIFIVEACLGFFYGALYKRIRNTKYPSLFAIVLFAIFAYPIINHFFDDVIFSRLSAWIQRALWLFLLTKTNIFIKSSKRRGCPMPQERKIIFKK